MRNVLLAVAIVALVAIVVTYAAERGAPTGSGGGPATLAGAPAPSFQVERLDGTSAALSDYRGRVVLVNLWASWCIPCREEMPDLERLYGEDARRGLVVLGVDQGESSQAAGAFVRAHGVTFPVLLDEDQRYGRGYAAIGLPTSVVVDRSGRVVAGYDGALTIDQMRHAVDPSLAQR
jgi:peroxiredoxin